MIMLGPCGSFRGSVGVSADPGPVESWEDVQTSSLLKGVSKRGVSGIHSDGALCWPKAARILKVKNFHQGSHQRTESCRHEMMSEVSSCPRLINFTRLIMKGSH